MNTSLNGSTTAKICAYARASHSLHGKNQIFNDTLASKLMGRHETFEVSKLLKAHAAPRQEILSALSDDFIPISLSRSAWAESEVQAFSEDKSSIQYVILGAGLDTFAWRNHAANIRTFEVDRSVTQNSKLSRLRALHWSLKRATFVEVDFGHDSLAQKLISKGFSPTLPTVFTILGVTYYLPLEIFSRTLKEIASLMHAPVRVLFDFRDDSEHQNSQRLPTFTASLGEPMAPGYNVKNLLLELKKLHFSGLFHLTPPGIEERYFKDRRDGLKAYPGVHFLKVSF